MMALVDAGVPLKDTVVSCTASLVKNVPLVDVNHIEQSGGSPELVVSILPHSGEVLLVYFDCIMLRCLIHPQFSDSVHVTDTTIPYRSSQQSFGYCNQRM